MSQRYFCIPGSFAENYGETITDQANPRAQRSNIAALTTASALPPPTGDQSPPTQPGVRTPQHPDQRRHLRRRFHFTNPETATLLRFPSSAIHSRSAEIIISRPIMVAAGSVTHRYDSAQPPAPSQSRPSPYPPPDRGRHRNGCFDSSGAP